jgi:hypothetical protein
VPEDNGVIHVRNDTLDPNSDVKEPQQEEHEVEELSEEKDEAE